MVFVILFWFAFVARYFYFDPTSKKSDEVYRKISVWSSSPGCQAQRVWKTERSSERSRAEARLRGATEDWTGFKIFVCIGSIFGLNTLDNMIYTYLYWIIWHTTDIWRFSKTKQAMYANSMESHSRLRSWLHLKLKKFLVSSGTSGSLFPLQVLSPQVGDSLIAFVCWDSLYNGSRSVWTSPDIASGQALQCIAVLIGRFDYPLVN